MKGVATSVSLILLYFGTACAYIALAIVAAANGIATPWLVVGALAACLALPFFVATLSFALAWIFRTPRT